MSTNTKPSQCDRILMYLQQYGSITALDAMREFGCMRLAARILDLKKKGNRIAKTQQTTLNRYGDQVSISRYYLEIWRGSEQQ